MYNRYVPGADGYIRITEEDAPPRRAEEGREPPRPPEPGPERREEPRRPIPPGPDLLQRLGEPLRFLRGDSRNAGAAGILKSLGLGELDSGDVLLMLILLFLLLEGDDWEPVIALGLMLLFSLNDGRRPDQKE